MEEDVELKENNNGEKEGGEWEGEGEEKATEEALHEFPTPWGWGHDWEELVAPCSNESLRRRARNVLVLWNRRSEQEKRRWIWGFLSLGIFIVLITLLFIMLSSFGVFSSSSSSSHSSTPPVPPLSGLESKYGDSITGDQVREHLRILTAAPHIAGSSEDYQTAQYVYQRFSEYFLSSPFLANFCRVEIEEFPVLLSYPLSRVVEIVSPIDHQFHASLQEPSVPEDPTSSHPRAVPTFNGYSAPGDVTGDLVYANYGRPEDYTRLEGMNIDLRGKVVIVRYGNGFRGNKARLAEERGAVAVLIYSDPLDDGSPSPQAPLPPAQLTPRPVYPQGRWRPPAGVQRGTVWTGDGDPLTPGWPSTLEGPRLSVDQVRKGSPTFASTKMTGWDALPAIPIQPLSHSDAEPLLRGLMGSGLEVPTGSDWQGGLGFKYYIGPGPAKVRVALEANFTTTSIWNVVATIQGREEPDRIVMIGNHRDAWVFGAGDPGSGTGTMLEIARGLGKVMNETHWRPRRTLMINSWDAEEYGLVGSREYVEKYTTKLKTRLVAHLNTDVAVGGTGRFYASGTPNLEGLIQDLAQQVRIKIKNTNKQREQQQRQQQQVTVWEKWATKRLEAIGAGSDHSPFIHGLGVSSVVMEFNDPDQSYEGVYHSNYDSFYWMENLCDGKAGYGHHVAIAEMMGRAAMRLAEEEVLPMDVERYGTRLEELVGWVKEMAEGIQDEGIGWRGAMLEEVKKLNRSVVRLRDEAKGMMQRVEQVRKEGAVGGVSFTERETRRRIVNDRLMYLDRMFLEETGTLGRARDKHIIYAPGLYNSYHGSVFPAITEAIANKDYTEATFQFRRAVQIMDSATDFLKE